MSPDEFRSGLLAIAAEFIRRIRSLLRVLPANPSDEVWDAFVREVHREMLRARRESYLLARDYYASQRADAVEPGYEPEPRERAYPVQVLDSVLERTTRAHLDGLEEWEVDRERIERETLATLERHVVQAGRDAVLDAASEDPQAVGFARVPSGAETCAFCLMLASRGAVYKSEQTARFKDGTRDPYHNNCDCVIVPVFVRNRWDGRERADEAKRIYDEAQKAFPDDPPLKALRKFLGEQSPDS